MMSRKRKSSSLEIPSTASEFHLPCKSHLREFGPFSRPNGQGNSHGISSNQAKSMRPETLGHQFQGNQFQQTDEFGEDNFTSHPVCMMAESPQFGEPSPLLEIPSAEIEYPSSLPVQRLDVKNAEKSLLEAVSQDQIRSWDKDHKSSDIVPVGMLNVSSEFVAPEAPSLHSSLPNGFCDDPETSSCSKEAIEPERSSLLWHCGQFLDSSGSAKFPYELIETVGVSGDAGQMHKESSLRGQIRSICSSPTMPLDVDSESRRAHAVGDSKLIESSAPAKSLETLVTCMSSSKHANSIGDGGKHDNSKQSNQDSKKRDGKGRSPGKRTSTAAEKLWEGSLQLNASIKVSAVAFFKSGEKLLDTNWSEYVEVKGKVRLEAFEKYIEDLHRSRTRGLMVIFLCWKEGSSESGLKGMKEFAKAYRKGERVGLARLSPGVDVYLCPRSNTIITILAKHGFFKGKAAVEGNSELLIGCVVWRKNQIPACSATEKKSEDKANPTLPRSPLDTSSNQQAGERISSFAPLASVDSSSVVDNVSVTESKNVPTGNHSCSRNLLPTSLVSNASLIPAAPQNPSYSTLPLIEGSGVQQLMEIRAASARWSETEYPKASLGVPELIISAPPSNVRKEIIPSTDVDDLPEFDFGGTEEMSLTSGGKPLDASALNKRLQHEGSKKSEFIMPQPTIAALRSVSVSNSRANNSSIHQQHGSTADRDKQMHVQQRNGRSQSLQTSCSNPVVPDARAFASTTKVAFNRFGKMNMFDDDDSMPEWIPPEQEKKTSSAERKAPSLTISSSNPVPFLVSSVAASSQAFYPPLPPRANVLPPFPPSPLRGFTFTPLLRPPSSSPPPIHSPLLPADKQRSRP